ncbi:MAG: ABC transporter substrate-binding protein, partial [Anaerolineaceae bacterium]
DPNAQRTAFEQKQLDGFSAGDPSVTRAIIAANKDKMYEYLTGVSNTVFLSLNMLKQFKDIRLVKAMNMAIDRRQLIQTFHQGLGQVSGPVTWLQEGYAVKPDDLIKNPGYRVDREIEKKEARDLWAAGGGPALGEIDIKIPDTWLARWPDTTQLIPKMLNDNLGVAQFKSTKTTYNEEIIPNLFNGNFPNWFGWTSEVNSPNPRAALRGTFLSSSGTNFNKVNNPDADKIITDFQGMTKLQDAVAKVAELQKILLDNAQYGQIVLYNYIVPTARWNYLKGNLKVDPAGGKSGAGYNLFSGHLAPSNLWLDTKDASYQGRPAATI